MTRTANKEQLLFERMPVPKAILELAFPSIIGQIILVIYNMADTLFVGMSGSDEMVTAVTVCMPAFMFLSAISNLFGVGGASVISRALGVKNRDRARNASRFAIWGCLITSVVYSLGAFLLMDTFVNLLGGSNPAVHGHARNYLLITVVIGGMVTAMNTLLSHLIRAEGHSLQASIGIAIGGILNIGLDPLFMFVILEHGQEAIGAAIATTLSNLIALIYFVAIIFRLRKKLSLSARPSRDMLQFGIPSDVIRVGIPACLMTLCENISYAILDNLMATVGLTAQTGIGVAKKVNMLAHSIVRGMTQGVLPLIGYNYASGNRKRMKSVVLMSGGMSIAISIVCTTISLIFATPLIELFIHSGTDAVDFGAAFLRILCLGAPFSACAYTVISFFQATGKGLRSLILALLRKGILDIPMMFILHALWPTYGIVSATPIADVICCIIAVIMFLVFLKHHGMDKVPPAPHVSRHSESEIELQEV